MRVPFRSLGLRGSLAAICTSAVNVLSRRMGRGQGTVLGGRLGLALDPRLLEKLAHSRDVVLVSGTNGKTTTTALVRAGWGGDVCSNETGANMPAGHVAALVKNRSRRVVLEVDEAWLPSVMATTQPRVVVVLNLSRDQLDRANEVRRVAQRWRESFAAPYARDTIVVANANDPLVVFAVANAANVRWCDVATPWISDALSCPVCTKPISFTPPWSCTCGLHSPFPFDAVLGSSSRVGEVPVTLALQVPGEFNRANALMALTALAQLGVDVVQGEQRLVEVVTVAGRFEIRQWRGQRWRLLLAKNPAGFQSLFTLVGNEPQDLVIAINANIADGRDPSWLYDVSFEDLRGRRVWCSGERALDLATRLEYGGVDFIVANDDEIVRGLKSEDPIDVIANYTAFAQWYDKSSPC